MYGGDPYGGDHGASQFAGGGFMPTTPGPAFGPGGGGSSFSPSAGGGKVNICMHVQSAAATKKGVWSSDLSTGLASLQNLTPAIFPRYLHHRDLAEKR